MDWQNLLEILVKFGISGATVTLVIGYLGKKVIDQYLSSRLENHKSNLDREIIQFKSNIERINVQSNLRYQRIFEERASIIKELYQLIAIVEKNIRILVSLGQGSEWIEEKMKEIHANSSLQNLYDVFSKNKIYFNSDQCNSISDLIAKSKVIIDKMSSAKEQAKLERDFPNLLISNTKLGENYFHKWESCGKDVDEIFMTAKQKLEAEFRQILDIT